MSRGAATCAADLSRYSLGGIISTTVGLFGDMNRYDNYHIDRGLTDMTVTLDNRSCALP